MAVFSKYGIRLKYRRTQIIEESNSEHIEIRFRPATETAAYRHFGTRPLLWKLRKRRREREGEGGREMERERERRKDLRRGALAMMAVALRRIRDLG